jgi:hypothetical protein
MKYFIIVLMMLSFTAVADQRFETVGGFCHFVTPEGFANGNDDNEVFFANCENSIRQNQDGTGSGSTLVKVKYPAGALPFTGKHTFTGAGTGVDCVMVDSNGTQYVTRDWTATYEAEIEGLDDFAEAFGTDDEDFDYNGDGIVNSLDTGFFKQNADGKIKYTISCFNGAQQ